MAACDASTFRTVIRSAVKTWAVRLFSRKMIPLSLPWLTKGKHTMERARRWAMYGSSEKGFPAVASSRITSSRVRAT